jgi:hypothetical protein
VYVCVCLHARVVCEWSHCDDALYVLASLGGHFSCSQDNQSADRNALWGGRMTGANPWLKEMCQHFVREWENPQKRKVISFSLHPVGQEVKHYSLVIHWTRPSMWSSGQSSWLHIQRPGFDSWRHQIFWEVVGLERGPLNLVTTTEELLERKSSGSGVENREHVRRNSSHWPRGSLYPQTLALTSPTSGGRSVGIVRSWT